MTMATTDERDEAPESSTRAANDAFADEELPCIEVAEDEARVADEALAELAYEAGPQASGASLLFVRGTQLVHIVPGGRTSAGFSHVAEAPQIGALTSANLRELLTKHMKFVSPTGDTGQPPRELHPPRWLIAALMERGHWSELRPLRAVVDTPILRPDGTVSYRPGCYDPQTATFLWSSVKWSRAVEWLDAPTRADAEGARDALLEPFADFPFESEAHRAACIAAVLTPFARHAFDGPAPLFAIDKPTPGTGGSLLGDVIGVIATGRTMARMSPSTDAAEERKRITSVALAGYPLVLIDNVAGTLGTDALNAALTGTEWADRLLGRNAVVRLPLVTTWYATGNNIQFDGDTLRRTCHIRLVAREERPEEREGWKHPRLLEWVRDNRKRLVVAALTMLRAYAVAGRPDMKLKPWGSFEGWSDVVRSAVVWCGLEDPGRTREELAVAANTERDAMLDFLRAWRGVYGDAGGTVADALKRLAARDVAGPLGALRDALRELCPMPKADQLPGARAVAAKIRKYKDRTIDSLSLRQVGDKGSAGSRWVVRPVVRSDSSDSRDSVLPVTKTRGRSKTKIGGSETESLESRESLPRRLRKRSQVHP